MYQTAWVKVSLSPRVPLALSRHPLGPTSNLQPVINASRNFLSTDFPENFSRAIRAAAILYRGTAWHVVCGLRAIMTVI